MTAVVEDFPVMSLLPKKETGVVSFLTKYPQYDGRGTTMAIFDSGVDPGAPGLQFTTEGERKVTHRFDCSGCGDVLTTTIVQNANGSIVGLTGRKLIIPDSWKNPTNSYRIGLKHGYSLYTRSLKAEMIKKNREKNFDPINREILAQTRRELSNYDAKDSNLSDVEKMKKEDLEARLEMLTHFEKKMTDPGPVYDCVLFHDGEMWRCCVDTSENGDLKDCPLLGEYSKTGDFAPLTKDSNLNFSINVHNDGDTLELVGLCSSHGTWVAGIAAAYFPNHPEENGVAPGCKIISLSIGDGRLGSMETGTALVRAMIKVMELAKTENIRVINMSYGEHSHWSNSGRIGELMCEVVDKYGITWLASAGNHGPALNTIGTPPDISQEVLIGVGAYVSPEMMVAAYSMRSKLPGMLYTWSSRGPTIDGGMGVTICAPGGAIAPTPTFTLAHSLLCNGTSMSCPHAAGVVSLLISALIKRNIPYSPYSMKRAIESGATYLPDAEMQVQGCGLVNVEKSFELLVANQKPKEMNVRFSISCGANKNKGIFRRNKLDVPFFVETVEIEPHFLDSDDIPAKEKIDFRLRLVLSCDASFVSAPTHLDLTNSPRSLAVKVDTSGLETGVHSTLIKAFDCSNIDKGAIFRIPVTVIIPQKLQKPQYSLSFSNVIFGANSIKRHFIHVPKLASWFRLHVSSKSEDTCRFFIHVMEIISQQSCKTIDKCEVSLISSCKEKSFTFQVVGGSTVEVVIAKFWSDLENVKLDYSFNFKGVKPMCPIVTMHAADGIQAMDVVTLQAEEVSPSIVINTAVQVVRPSESKISPLTHRDVIPPSRQIYELLLVYNFSITKTTEVTPNMAPLSDVLYEGEFESQLWMLFDSNKQLKASGDAYPMKYSTKLEKGDYVIRYQIRHEKTEYLEKLSEIPILVQQKIHGTFHVDFHATYSNAILGNKKVSTFSVILPTGLRFYLSPIQFDKIPKLTAQYLLGKVSYVKDEVAAKIDTYPFRYMLVEGNNKKSSNNNESSSTKSKLEDVNDQIRDTKIQMFSKMDLATAEIIYKQLSDDEDMKDFTKLNLYSSFLAVIDPLEPKSLPLFKEEKINEDTINRVISICDNIINTVDADALLIHFAIKTDAKVDATKTKRMEQQKSALIDALCRKGIAKCRLVPEKNFEESNIFEEIAEIWKSLGRFVDLNDTALKSTAANVLYFLVWHSYAYKCYSKTFKYLWRLQEDQRNKQIEKKLIELSNLNGWPHVERHLKRTILSKFCDKYEPF